MILYPPDWVNSTNPNPHVFSESTVLLCCMRNIEYSAYYLSGTVYMQGSLCMSIHCDMIPAAVVHCATPLVLTPAEQVMSQVPYNAQDVISLILYVHSASILLNHSTTSGCFFAASFFVAATFNTAAVNLSYPHLDCLLGRSR